MGHEGEAEQCDDDGAVEQVAGGLAESAGLVGGEQVEVVGYDV